MTMATLTQPRYAQVVILLPIDRRPVKVNDEGGDEGGLETLIDFDPEKQTFTYGITPARRGQYRPGQVVWAPFGRGQQQGVILRLSETAPQGITIKPLGEPVAAEPALNPVQIELALWLSRHYLAPLSECVRLILPPGYGARIRLLVEYVSGAPIHPHDLTPTQQALALHIRRGALPLTELRQLDRRLAAEDVLGDLLEKGVLRLRDEEIGSAPKPKTERRVLLAEPAADIDRALMQLGRPSKQAEALAWLGEHPNAAPQLEELSSTIGATTGPIAKLAERGLIEITPENEVRLAVLAARVPAAVIELRGSERYRRVLETLALAGEDPVWVGWLYAEANTDAATLRRLADAGVIEIREEEVWRDPWQAGSTALTPPRR